MKTIHYGVVGTGYFGAGLARLLAQQEGANIVSVYDPDNGQAFAKEIGATCEKSLEDLVHRADIDAVLVATPNYLHAAPVILSAKNKKHIFCEKPIALSYAQCDTMVKAASENGVVFMAGHVMNFMSGVRKVKELINNGALGDLLFAHACRNGWGRAQETISWKKIREKSGGHLYHHIHELDFIQFLMGPATAGYMVGGNLAHKGENFGDEDDMLFITLEFAGNKFATMQYGSAYHMGDHFVKIQGSKGAALLDLQDTKVIVKTEAGETRYLLHETKEEDEDRTAIYAHAATDGAIAYGKPGQALPMWLSKIMLREMEFFHQTLQGIAPTQEFAPLLDGTAARAAIATADALTLSINEKRRVLISEIQENRKDDSYVL